MLTVHHLTTSQSERIVWLCEELDIQYRLVIHGRDYSTGETSPSLKEVPGNALGAAPIIQDGPLSLAQSGAIVEYILQNYDPDGRLHVEPRHPDWPQYVYWLHVANAELHPRSGQPMLLQLVNTPADNPIMAIVKARYAQILSHMDERLGETTYLAGDKFTAADCMCLYSVSTGRFFSPFDLGSYPNILRWMQACGDREGYKRAMAKGDPGFTPMLDARGPTSSFFDNLSDA